MSENNRLIELKLSDRCELNEAIGFLNELAKGMEKIKAKFVLAESAKEMVRIHYQAMANNALTSKEPV